MDTTRGKSMAERECTMRPGWKLDELYGIQSLSVPSPPIPQIFRVRKDKKFNDKQLHRAESVHCLFPN